MVVAPLLAPAEARALVRRRFHRLDAARATPGTGLGLALVAAIKGMKWESPRGPISIDPDTRDVVQNVYVRKVEKVGVSTQNVEIDTIPNVKDPAK